MKTSIIIIAAALAASSAYAEESNTCYRTCAAWDTFCKSPAQIVATKCRLGVPVKHGQCEALGIPSHYMVRGGGSLVEGMPCTSLKLNITTDAVIKQ